jgi:hypothetical protein
LINQNKNMCFTKLQASKYFQDEAAGWISGTEKTKCLEAVTAIEDESEDSDEALLYLNDLFWTSSQITSKSCFGQALYTLSETVDPNRPMPEVRV